MFAFVVHPLHQPNNAKLFLHAEIAKIPDFAVDELQSVIKQMFNVDYDVEDMEFYEIGKYNPITFEKEVSYTIYQGD